VLGPEQAQSAWPGIYRLDGGNGERSAARLNPLKQGASDRAGNVDSDSIVAPESFKFAEPLFTRAWRL